MYESVPGNLPPEPSLVVASEVLSGESNGNKESKKGREAWIGSGVFVGCECQCEPDWNADQEEEQFSLFIVHVESLLSFLLLWSRLFSEYRSETIDQAGARRKDELRECTAWCTDEP